MNEQALRNLLSGSLDKIAAIDADLAKMQKNWDDSLLYHQGYQNGRKAELELLVGILKMVPGVLP